MDLPCGRIVTATHEDGTEWCMTHDPEGEFAKQNAAFAQRVRDARDARTAAMADRNDMATLRMQATLEDIAVDNERAAIRISDAPAYLTLPQLQRQLDRLLPGQCTTPTTSRKLERRRY